VSTESNAVTAAVHVIGFNLPTEDRDAIGADAGPDLGVRWLAPAGTTLSGLIAQEEGAAFTFLVFMLGLGVDGIVKPPSREDGEGAGGGPWRSVEKLVTGVWQRQAAASDGRTSDSYVIFEMLNDLVAIKLAAPGARPARAEAALRAQLESLAVQWVAVLGELHKQTRGQLTRVYVLAEQDGEWSLSTPSASEAFLTELRPGGVAS